jgi:hypothetical protein
MSDLTSTAATSALTSSSSLTSGSGLTAADFSNEPSAIRTGNAAARSAYSTGVAFEQILFEQLTQAMSATTDDDSNGIGGSDSSDDTSGSDALSQSAYSSMIPQTLAQSMMSSGAGTSLAMQVAKGIDPSLTNASPLPSTGTTGSTAATGSTGSTGGTTR